jgi:hypothetical protein
MNRKQLPPDVEMINPHYFKVEGELTWKHIIATLQYRRFHIWRNLVVLAMLLASCFLILVVFAFRHGGPLTIWVSLATAIAAGSSIGSLIAAMQTYRQMSIAVEALQKAAGKDATEVISVADQLIKTGSIIK